MNPLHFGWEADATHKTLVPKIKVDGTPDAPEDVLKLVRCGCLSDHSC